MAVHESHKITSHNRPTWYHFDDRLAWCGTIDPWTLFVRNLTLLFCNVAPDLFHDSRLLPFDKKTPNAARLGGLKRNYVSFFVLPHVTHVVRVFDFEKGHCAVFKRVSPVITKPHAVKTVVNNGLQGFVVILT